MKAGQALKLLGMFTAEQWGMITSQQAKGLGVDGVTVHRLDEAGHLDRVRRGVYAVTTATVTPGREEQAAWLALNPTVPAWQRSKLDPDGGVLSHQSAARLHGLGELVNDGITLTTPRRRTSRDPDLWFKTRQLSADEVAVIDGLPVTTALRTICDLLDQHIDGSHIATIISQAVEANLVQLDAVAEGIAPYAQRYGVRRSRDGEALLDQLLLEIGTTAAQLMYRPAPPRAALAHHAAYTATIAAARPDLVGMVNAAVATAIRPTLVAANRPGVVEAMNAATATVIRPDVVQAIDAVLSGAIQRDYVVPEARRAVESSACAAETDTGFATDDPIDDDGRHGHETSAHAERLPRLPEEQGAEQVEGDGHPSR